LFGDFSVHGVGKFLGPILKAENVATLIVDALESQESKFILTPFINNFTPGIKAFPSFIRDVIQWSAGGDGSYPSRPLATQLANEV
jgi:all-trans-retinol dehydrogenase (NAD+)